MCNEVARRIELGLLRDDFSQLRIPLRFPGGVPNMAPLASIRITDRTEVVRAATDAPGEAEMVTLRWSWPGPSGKPVYNFRSEGRDLRGGRCLVPVDGFYEFTAPVDAGAKRKDRWLFTDARHPWFAIAALWRADEKVGEAFTLLTTSPGPDVAPYHDRQVVVIDRSSWSGWLDGSAPARELCRPAPAGTFSVAQVVPPAVGS